jgi:hypothetical protein
MLGFNIEGILVLFFLGGSKDGKFGVEVVFGDIKTEAMFGPNLAIILGECFNFELAKIVAFILVSMVIKDDQKVNKFIQF